MNKKAQLASRELIGLIAVGIFLIIALPLITAIISAAGGSIETSISSIIAAFIPLFFFAILFELIRRLFG